ncbi:MAG: hypothetical protein QW835_00670 [Candidatus Hadarchaeum sp.]
MKLKKWRVGISKFYFPPELRPKTPGEEFFEVFEIMASSRTEAANLIWKAMEIGGLILWDGLKPVAGSLDSMSHTPVVGGSVGWNPYESSEKKWRRRDESKKNQSLG